MKAKIRDINPFGLRIPSEMRDRLERACQHNKRSLNSEILKRLERSLDQDMAGENTLQQERGDYTVLVRNNHEQALLARYRDMPTDQQLALLTLLRALD